MSNFISRYGVAIQWTGITVSWLMITMTRLDNPNVYHWLDWGCVVVSGIATCIAWTTPIQLITHQHEITFTLMKENTNA